MGIDVPCDDQGVAQLLCGLGEFRVRWSLADRGQEGAGVFANVGVPPRVSAGVGDKQGGELCSCRLARVVGGSPGYVIRVAQGRGVTDGGKGEVEPECVVESGQGEGARACQGSFGKVCCQGGPP